MFEKIKKLPLAIGAIFSGCTPNTQVAVKEKLSHADYNIIMENPIVEGIKIEKVKLCDLNVKGNRIVTTDPLVVPDLMPLERSVPSGTYPVYLYIAKTENSGDRIAIAVLELREDRADRFVLATRDGENVSELEGKTDFFGFPVDAGLGAFYDDLTSREYNQFIDSFYKKNPNANIYDDLLAAKFKKNAREPDNPNDYGDWVCFTLPGTDSTVAMFQSGYGDGVYPSSWGVDTSGEACNLIIDFHVLLLPE